MLTLRIVVPGRPSTDHRVRFSGIARRGHPIMRTSSDMRAWKDRVRAAALAVLPPDWPLHAIGPRGGKWPLYYGVIVIGYATSDRYDADNLRGLPDALQKICWPSDRRCKPVVYDVVAGCDEERVVADIVAWDPRTELCTARLEVTRHG